MADFRLREFLPDDVPALISLWCTCFDDTESFVRAFFSALPEIGSGIVAECGGIPVSAAYTLNGQELVNGGKSRKVGYIYGVATDPRFRGLGIGGAVVRETARLSKKLGAEIISTLPAEESLYQWYEDLIGVKKRLCREKICTASKPCMAVSEISTSEYATKREMLLHEKAHLRLSPASFEFEGTLLQEYGGGFFSVGDGVAAAYIDGETALIRELIGTNACDYNKYAASVGAALGVSKAELSVPSASGCSYIAADCELPADCIWNLSFD